MKQVNRRKERVERVSRCLPVLFCVLCMLLMGTIHAGAQTGGAATPVQTPEEAGAPPAGEPSVELPAAVMTQPQATMPKDISATVERVKESLTKAVFAYVPTNMLDPFVPFISPAEVIPPTLAPEEEEGDLEPEQRRPLTPLQRMTLGELEKGLKAITWGEMGRRAVIEDSAGKGYIVGVGTPAGDRNGVVSEIFNDRLVIQQEVWDRNAKRMVQLNSVVKLKKDTKEK